MQDEDNKDKERMIRKQSQGETEILFDCFATLAAAPGGIGKIRELILQLAVQGKLVPQNPDDEPASVLLERIKAEKARLVKEGKIKKSKPLPPVAEDEVPFELPKGWMWVRIEDMAKIVHYGYTASANPERRDIRLLRITDIQNNRVDWNTVPGCDINPKDFESYRLQNGDLLIARTGGTIGKSFLVENLDVSAVFASYLIRIIVINKIYQKFLKLFADSPLYWEQLYSKCSGTGQPNVNGTALKSLLFPLPPLVEQHRIVEKVDVLMKLCDELKARQMKQREMQAKLGGAALASLTEAEDAASFTDAWARIGDEFNLIFDTVENVTALRQAVLQLAVQGKLVPQNPQDEPASVLLERIKAEKARLVKEGVIKKSKALPPVAEDEVPFELPEGWMWIRTNEIAKIIEYGTSHKSFPDVTGVPVFRMNNIQNGKITYENLKFVPKNIADLPRLYLNNGDILFNRTNSYELVGKTGIFKGDDNCYTFASYLIRVEVFKPCIVPDYINLTLNSEYFRKTQIEPEITQQCGQANFNGTKFKNSLIPLPPLPEQHRIVEKVDALMKLCDELEQRIQKRKEIQTKFLDSVVSQIAA